MDTPVLSTKLFVPSLRTDLVLRQRLIDQLNAAGQRKLTLVSAPAGYGKTTLISNWLHEARIPSAWFSLEEDDNDPIRFLQCFILALQRISSSIGLDLPGMLQGAPSAAPFETIITLLINQVAELEAQFILVLDDFHLIHAQAILDMVAFLLERMPLQMHLVLVSRTDPTLPLARLRSRNEILDIRVDELRFTLDETAFFLNEVMGLKLLPGDIAAMAARTEGWIASLQLAALSLQGSKNPHAFIMAFAGSHHYIMDYLLEEVLNLQSERVRSFLLQTSILGRMCGSLCNSVVKADGPESIDGQAILESLEHKNLFVIPLDDQRHWYRYHHLFADVLNRRLEQLYPQLLPELHSRASQWYEQKGLIPEAIQHTLAAGDHDRAIQLIEQNGCLLLIRGEVSTLPHWIKAVEPHAQDRPWMYIFKAWLFALGGHPDRVEEMLQTAERLISSEEPTIELRTMQGTIATARAYQANMRGETSLAAAFARQALEYLPDIDLVSRSLRTVATALRGDASSMNGDLEDARQAYLEAKKIGEAAGDIHLIIVANSNLANILIEQGLLHQAYMIYSETLEMATRPDGQQPVIAGRLYAELSQVSYEWNNLETAMQQVHQCLALCRQWGNMDQQAVGFVLLARLEHVQSHPESALEAMRMAEKLASEYHLLPRYSAWVKYSLARLWLAQGDLEKASHLIQQDGMTAEDEEIPYLREPEYLILLRLLLAQGDHDPVLALSKRLLQQAEGANRMGRAVEILVLEALAHQGKKEPDQALASLARAFALARPERYVRAFLDEGAQMAKLLHLARSRQVEAAYATELLSAMGETGGGTQAPAQNLIEPLSRRELEVLQLIEAGCSNQEIAARLVISIATVKRHISNIYAKLGVQSRTEAVSIGKELKIFG